MVGCHHVSSALTLLVLLTGASFLRLSTSNQISRPGDVNDPHRDTSTGLSEDRQIQDEERRSLNTEEAEEEELFKDVDPRTLAAVLLEALNQSQVQRRMEGEERDGVEEDVTETWQVKKGAAYRESRVMEGADRDGRRELELLMAAQENEQEEKERATAREEEEKLTEKVTSRTTSQMVQVQTEKQPTNAAGGGETGLGAVSQQGQNTPEQGINEEEEEQLNPEELKNLETMMKEFPRLNTATKREGEPNQRDSRDYSSYNDVIQINKASNLAMSKKKLKWQEETQKAFNFPMFRGNFMDDFQDAGNYAGGNIAQPQIAAEQEVEEGDEPEEEEEEENEEVLSPEEEEARAKAEQEEMRRQAAEAQRAKMKEEKLADIASDMLLRYMVKQNNGSKKYGATLSNAAEDKRSDEEQEVAEEDEIDPQTIDKLIEISSKLHLPADDVVDIISDVEKKKKKDLSPEMTSRWQQPLASSSSLSPSYLSTNQNRLAISKQPSPAKTWIQEKPPTKTQDIWRNLAKPLFWPKPQQPQQVWLKSQKPRYPFNSYPSYYQRRPYPDYQPFYFPPAPRPKPRYYIPKTSHALNNLLGYSMGAGYTFPPKRRYQSWVQPRLRKPPAGLQQKPYPFPLYHRTFRVIPKPPSPPKMRQILPQPKPFYFSPQGARSEDYYRVSKQQDSSNSDNLEQLIKQMLMKRLQKLD